MHIKKPQKNNFINNFLDIFFKGKIIEKNNRNIVAINILYQTNSIDSIEIIEPKIAVNPNIKTIK